jgi:hypothetical protein
VNKKGIKGPLRKKISKSTSKSSKAFSNKNSFRGRREKRNVRRERENIGEIGSCWKRDKRRGKFSWKKRKKGWQS